MRPKVVWTAASLLFRPIVTWGDGEGGGERGSGAASNDEFSCRLYLAESSIPNAGLGAYSGVDLDGGEYIGEKDIVLPILHGWTDFFSVWNDFVWMMNNQSVPFELEDMVYPGIGAHTNCHLGLINMERGKILEYDSADLHRGRDPAVGSFSYLHSMRARAGTKVKAGSELFVDYSENWFEEREDKVGKVPFREHYDAADKILENVSDMHMSQEDWSTYRNKMRERVRMALPDNIDDVPRAAEMGSAHFNLPNFIRDKRWLEENGMCVDNLFYDTSKIAGAGRGAFARRSMAVGEVIAPAPLIHMARTGLPKYWFEDGHKEDGTEEGHEQLLLNYCFGHPKSSLLLLPYSPVVNAINHSREPNAVIRWSKSKAHESDWLSLTTRQLVSQKTRTGLLMEYVALRDIEKGEEIYIDYGKEWEDAWRDHVRSWKPVQGAAQFVYPSELVRNADGTPATIRTRDEQRQSPYPEHVATGCIFHPYDFFDEEEEYDADIIYEVDWDRENYDCHRPCDILNRTVVNGEEFYEVQIYNPNDYLDWCHFPEEVDLVVKDMPREAVSLVENWYEADQHLPNAFRHEIGVPQGFFPESWLDVAMQNVGQAEEEEL